MGGDPSEGNAAVDGWLRPPALPVGCGMLMTTRGGGASDGPYASSNTSFDVGDDPAAVEANRSLLRSTLGAEPVYLHQVHGSVVIRLGVADIGAPPRQADASITDVRGLACVVQAADCLPVLFATRDATAVGAAHAGWRGLAAGVLEATVAALCELAQCAPGELAVWLGACIGPQQFEVGPDVLAAFGVEREDPAAATTLEIAGSAGAGAPARRFVATRPGKWLADLPGLARDRLRAAGVGRLSGGEWDTVADPSRFFSYRRDGVTGRMAAAVWLER